MDPVPDTSWPRPRTPRISARASYAAHAVLARNGAYRALASFVERHPGLERAFTSAERFTKNKLFGCRMCAQCALPATAYACPMTCPKQLRNGPCGGVGMDGSCEVYPGDALRAGCRPTSARTPRPCPDLRRLQRPIDQRKWDQSSWINFWLGRDEGLWTDDRAIARQPDLLHEPLSSDGARRGPTTSHCSRLQARLAAGAFAVTAELGPPRGAERQGLPPQGASCCATGSTPPT